MKHVHFFLYNIPADNQFNNRTDVYIPVVAEWTDDNFYNNGSPMVRTSPVNFTFYECLMVKDWHKAIRDIEKIATDHFAEVAKQERINQARAILEETGNPVLDRFNTLS